MGSRSPWINDVDKLPSSRLTSLGHHHCTAPSPATTALTPVPRLYPGLYHPGYTSYDIDSFEMMIACPAELFSNYILKCRNLGICFWCSVYMNLEWPYPNFSNGL